VQTRTSRVKPLVKWAGGKQALADRFVASFPNDFSAYYEPFVGGASVLLALEPSHAVVGDSNAWLLDLYVAVRRNWRRVAAALDRLRNTKDEYLRIRAVQPSELELYERAAQLIYLNKTCFRGLFRVNRLGRFNVPYGDYRRRYYDPENLRAVSRRLRDVEIRRDDFESCLHDVSSADFVYLDPPYYKLGGYSDFNRYTAGRFGDEDHARLATVCRELDQRGVRWALSNSDTAFVRRLYRGFRIGRVKSRREINLNAGARGVTELLITNY